MLTLPIRTIGNLLAIDDDTGRVHVTLTRPRVARRSDGTNRLRLVRWTTTNGTVAPDVGGRLTLDVETYPSEEEIAAAGLSPRVVSPLPWLDASIRLDGPQFEPIEAQASTAIGTGSSIATDLSPSAAAVLAPLLRADAVTPLQVTWTGHVLVRLPPVEVIATANVDEVRRRISMSDANKEIVISRSIINANARIEIRGAANTALEEALRDWVLDELAARFAQGQSLSIRAAAADVVRWPVRLATTIDDLIPPSSRHALVETVLLDADGPGRVPATEVRVLGDFAGLLERVDVRLASASGSLSEEIACTDDAPRRVALGTLDFRWSSRVKLKGRRSGEWSAWGNIRGSSSLLVPVAIPTTLAIEVLAVGLDFTNRWTSVRVTLVQQVRDSAPMSHEVELTAIHTSETWTGPIDGVPDSLTARLAFVGRQGQVVEQTIGEIAGNQIVVTDPLDNHRVRVSLVPAGSGWRDVSLVMVDLRYVDGTHSVDETLELHTLDDFVEWEAPARSDGPRAIQWRQHASFKNGDFRSSGWQTADAGVLVVKLDGIPRREIQLLPIYFDPATTQKATVRLRSESQIETIAIADRSARSVTLGPGPFTWTIAWTTADGTPLPETPAQNGEDVIVIPRFQHD